MTNVIDSGSTWNPRSTASGPTSIQLAAVWTPTRSSADTPSMSSSITRPITNVAVEASTPSQWPHRSLSRPTRSSRAAPISGVATSQGARESVCIIEVVGPSSS